MRYVVFTCPAISGGGFYYDTLFQAREKYTDLLTTLPSSYDVFLEEVWVMEEKFRYLQKRMEYAYRQYYETKEITWLHQAKFFELQRNIEREIYLHS